MSSPDRQLGIELYNSSWALMEKPDRTPAQDDELVHHVHASVYHWLEAPECEPKNRARGEWLCSRAYSVLGRAEPALHHARRCVAYCEQHPGNVADWDLAFAYEALARATSPGTRRKRAAMKSAPLKPASRSRTPTTASSSRKRSRRSSRTAAA